MKNFPSQVSKCWGFVAWAGGPPHRWPTPCASSRIFNEGAPSRLPSAGWGLSSDCHRTSVSPSLPFSLILILVIRVNTRLVLFLAPRGRHINQIAFIRPGNRMGHGPPYHNATCSKSLHARSAFRQVARISSGLHLPAFGKCGGDAKTYRHAIGLPRARQAESPTRVPHPGFRCRGGGLRVPWEHRPARDRASPEPAFQIPVLSA